MIEEWWGGGGCVRGEGAEAWQWILVHWREQSGQIFVCLIVTFEIKFGLLEI